MRRSTWRASSFHFLPQPRLSPWPAGSLHGLAGPWFEALQARVGGLPGERDPGWESECACGAAKGLTAQQVSGTPDPPPRPCPVLCAAQGQGCLWWKVHRVGATAYLLVEPKGLGMEFPLQVVFGPDGPPSWLCVKGSAALRTGCAPEQKSLGKSLRRCHLQRCGR